MNEFKLFQNFTQCIDKKQNFRLNPTFENGLHAKSVLPVQYLEPECDNVKISEGKLFSRLLAISQTTSERL